MLDSIWFAAGGVVAAGSAWYLIGPRAARKASEPSPRARWEEQEFERKTTESPIVSSKYRAVSITPGAFCCQAVREIEDQRFLSQEAPMIPLKGCDQAQCECVYEHHGDRRSEDDRRNAYAVYSGFDPIQDENDRRVSSGDRRKQGKDWFI